MDAFVWFSVYCFLMCLGTAVALTIIHADDPPGAKEDEKDWWENPEDD